MTSNPTKRKVIKIIVILVLVWFLAFTALSAVMYLSTPKQAQIQEMMMECENVWWVRDEEIQQCFEDAETIISPKEECVEIWWTRYEENEVCVN